MAMFQVMADVDPRLIITHHTSDYHGLAGIKQISLIPQAEQSSDAIKEVWELLTSGLQALNEAGA